MNAKVRGTEDYEEQGFKLPKSRNLLPSKKYRESVLRWGEPSQLKRRRVIIVPSIKCPARDISATTDGKGRRRLIQILEIYSGVSEGQKCFNVASFMKD